jgi:CRISPR-associated protein Csm2
MANYHNKSRGRREDAPSIDLTTFKQHCKAWIQEEFTHQTIEFTEEFGDYLVGNKLTTSQIRNIFGEVKRIQGKIKGNELPKDVYRDFLLLKPKMAYAAQRAGGRGIKKFKEVMDEAYAAVVEAEEQKRGAAFNSFTDFFEAILAYHKAAGGRD